MTEYTELKLNGEDKTAEIQEFGRLIGLDTAAPGRCSKLLLIELYAKTILLQRINPAKVLHEIRNLEAGTESVGTKPATQFKHAPLCGLWHKHYLQDDLRSMAINLRHALLRHGLPLFDQRIRDAQEANEERYMSKEDVAAITRDAVMGNWLRRAESGELTGE